MNSIPRVSLEDTLSLMQLVRETALAQGRETQAQQLSPVMEEMQELVAASRKSQPTTTQSVNSGVMGQTDFRTLLDLTKVQSQPDTLKTQSAMNSAIERNRLIQAMASANMSDVDIARQFAMTREEVRLVLSIGQKSQQRTNEVFL